MHRSTDIIVPLSYFVCEELLVLTAERDQLKYPRLERVCSCSAGVSGSPFKKKIRTAGCLLDLSEPYRNQRVDER